MHTTLETWGLTAMDRHDDATVHPEQEDMMAENYRFAQLERRLEKLEDAKIDVLATKVDYLSVAMERLENRLQRVAVYVVTTFITFFVLVAAPLVVVWLTHR